MLFWWGEGEAGGGKGRERGGEREGEGKGKGKGKGRDKREGGREGKRQRGREKKREREREREERERQRRERDRELISICVPQCQEFSEVFNLCVEVLEKADKPSLIQATLEAMLKFLNWIPLGYIFETPVIDHLISRVSRISFYLLLWLGVLIFGRRVVFGSTRI